ncbi:MAG: WD40 repeat domain-containing protein [Rubripirellula sp.]|nr:WD40 repeat domain-containing protein [Rubripirellula sp.]
MSFPAEINQANTQPNELCWIDSELIVFGNNQKTQAWSSQQQWELERTIGSPNDASLLSDRITAMDFRKDGLSLAIGSGSPSRAGEVKVFSVETGELIRDFGEIHSDSVLGLRFSPRGNLIASSAADKTVRLLDISSGQVKRSLEGHTHHVLAIAWQDDEQTLASASADKTIKIWDIETGEQRRTITGFGKEITALNYVAATNQLATACADGQARLYDTSNGNSLRSFNANGDFLYSLATSLDGKQLLSSGQSGTLRLWNIEDGKLIHEWK